MKKELKEAVYDKILKYPQKNDYELVPILKAEGIDVSRTTIYNTRRKFYVSLDYTLAQRTAALFMAEFELSIQYFKEQIGTLEAQKTKKNKIINDKGEVIEVDKTDAEIRDIMSQQESLWKSILQLARSGQAVEVMRAIRNGQIGVPERHN